MDINDIAQWIPIVATLAAIWRYSINQARAEQKQDDRISQLEKDTSKDRESRKGMHERLASIEKHQVEIKSELKHIKENMDYHWSKK